MTVQNVMTTHLIVETKDLINVKYSASENALNSLEELLAGRLQVGVVAGETGGTVSHIIPGVVARLPG